MHPAQSKMARAALKLGVREAAEAAKVSTQTVSRLESGNELRERTVEDIKTLLRSGAGALVETNRQLNLALYMVGRLAPAEVPAVRRRFEEAMGGRFAPVPDDLLNGSDYTETLFLEPVAEALGRSRISTVVVGSGGRGGRAVTSTYYGEAVIDFVIRHGAAFWTGQQPYRSSQPPSSCFVTGTPIARPDGGLVAIEAVAEGEEVLAADGSATRRDDETILHRLDHQTPVYGINDTPPFVTAGHMLLTTQGWKAIDPEAAWQENPDVAVSALQIGDRLIRLAGTSSFRTEEVVLERLDLRMLPAGSALHALKLTGAQSYFANGFAVAANYPHLPEARLAEAIESLPEATRAQLQDLLRPVMPLLLEALCDVAGPRLRAALGDTPEPQA